MDLAASLHLPPSGYHHPPRRHFLGNAETVHPDSGSGCNYDLDDDMCIYVQATGLYVSSWDTQVVNNFNLDSCTYAGYWVNGGLYTTSNEVCGTGDYWAYLTVDRNFLNQTQHATLGSTGAAGRASPFTPDPAQAGEPTGARWKTGAAG